MIDYLEGSIVGVPKNGPGAQNPVIFINTATGAGQAAGEWHTVDLSAIVPEGTIVVRLDGLLLITHGTTQETANLTVAFRDDPSWEYGYNMQTIECWVGGGQRTNAGAWVAVGADRKFQFKWTRSSNGSYPEWSAYGINLCVTAYVKQGQQADIEQLQADVAALSQAVAALQALQPGSDARLTTIIDFIKADDC